MKKLFTLLTILVLLANTAMASETVSSNEEKLAVSLLIKSVDRSAINALTLNEMQYIQLRNLSKQYNKDVAALSNASLMNEVSKDVNLEQINHRYYTELNSILSAEQISTFLQQNTVALNN